MTFVSSHHEAVVIVVVLPADDFKGQNLMSPFKLEENNRYSNCEKKEEEKIIRRDERLF